MSAAKSRGLVVQGRPIGVAGGGDDYLSLTDMLRAKDGEFFIADWLRNRNTVEFLGVWERVHNPGFNYGEFATMGSRAGLNSYRLSVKDWIDKTGAIGLRARAGRYGSTFAHPDIAFEFAMWISPECKVYLVQKFRRLKSDEAARESQAWSFQRTLAKLNYRIHTDAIQEHLVPPALTKGQTHLVYASEADLLNMALFGKTAAAWRAEAPKRMASRPGGNVRDQATIEQLVVLSNLESLNAVLIGQGLAAPERLRQLNAIAIVQMRSLLTSTSMKRLAAPEKKKRKTRLELTWIGKENRPRLEPRILLEDPELSYAKRVSESDIFDNMLIQGDNLLALKALEQRFAGKVVAVDPVNRRVDIRKKHAGADNHPTAMYTHAIIPGGDQASALYSLGENVATEGVDATGVAARAGRDLLLRRPPRLTEASATGPLRRAGETTVDAAKRLVLDLDGGVLALQGPPGAGKTFTAAEMIVALVARGRRVGITAMSHKVIRNLLDAVVEAAERHDVRVRCLHKVAELSYEPDELDYEPVQETADAKAMRPALEGRFGVGAGTTWLWSREDLAESVDTLFIDEAGQMSLANVLAVSRAAKNLVLLGDPQQLEQPLRGSHPEGPRSRRSSTSSATRRRSAKATASSSARPGASTQRSAR